jgi:Protein of unknown function (DUF4238)
MPSNDQFKHNHYVPEWYQKRFILDGQGKYWYLDLKPEQVVRDGHKFTRRDLLLWGPASCFAEHDLYTVKWGSQENVDIEKFFFGRVDSEGKSAVEFFADFKFDHPGQEEAYHGLMNYMSVQKIRTPKGLGWLSGLPEGRDRNMRLLLLQRIQNMYCAIWTECIWQIADATRSTTKFIISDHPVTVYNRGCFPGSAHCVGFNDADIRMAATHTYFPLSMEKILILTNLSWVRNPYQNEHKPRPNPRYFHDTIFKFTDIQTYRSLAEQEVREINYITKRRALRYIAAAERDWLYPERYLPSTHWNKFGNGLLLMPEPRDIHMGGEIIIGYEGGGAEAFSEYGHKPWQPGYKDDKRFAEEAKALQRFQAEWAVMQGPEYRGTSFQFHREHEGPYVTPDEFYQHDLERARRYKR